jgi:IclR family acetate operon transcriptional repressor
VPTTLLSPDDSPVTMHSPKNIDSGFVLERLLRILGAFTNDRIRLKVPEIVDITGLPRATIYRLTAQMEGAGLLVRDGAHMSLGVRLFEIGQLVPSISNLSVCAQSYLEDLRDATRGTVHLAIPAGIEVIYVGKLVGHAGPALPSRVGGRMPAYCTGVGKALLAYQPDSVVRDVLTGGMRRRTPYSICTPGRLLRELQEVRATGLAYEREESQIGVICVASPIIFDDVAIAAVSISGWTSRFESKRISAAVKSTAMAISEKVGRLSALSMKLSDLA